MTLTVNITNQERPLVNLAKRMAIVGVSSGGTTDAPYQLTSGVDVPGTIGYAPATDLIQAIHRVSASTEVEFMKVAADVAGVISSVTETPPGNGPTITVSGSPYDTYNVKVKVVKQGIVGNAVVRIALDGATYGDDIPLPEELAAAVTGTIDLTSVNLADLDTLTVILTTNLGGPVTTTLTTPTTFQDIADQINAAIQVSTDEAFAEIVSGRYLKLSSLTVGSSSTLSLGAGTAHAALGLTGGPFTGTPSQIVLSTTGLTITFPSTSAYVLNTVYSFTTTQPRFSASALATALSTLREWAKVSPDLPQTLGAVFVLCDPVDGAETRQFANQISTDRALFHSDFLFPMFYMGASLHVASSALSTNNSNIATNDAAVKLAMQGHVDAFVDVSEGDVYMTGDYGSLRRSLVYWVACFWARERISSDPGNRSLPSFSDFDTRAPDLVTFARNENIATHKMRAARFTTAKREGGQSYIERGVTRADPAVTPKFKHSGVVNACLLGARQLTPFARRYENTDPFLTPAGRILPAEADAIETAGNSIVQNALIAEQHVSAGNVTVDRTEQISDTERLTLNATLQAKGQILTVALTVGAVGTLTSPLSIS